MKLLKTDYIPNTWEFELNKSAKKYHVIACWVAIVLDPIWVISDYFVIPLHWIDFLILRLLVALLTFIGLQLRNRISVELLIFIPVLGISLQNAYMYSVMEIEEFRQHTFAYIALFIGVGMLVFWPRIYSIIVVGISLIANILLCSIFSPLSLNEILINGGLLTLTVAIFSIFLIQLRYRLTKSEIITRLELRKSKIELQDKNEIIEEKNKDITDSINYAQNIQQAILPNNTELQKSFGDYFVLYIPKDIVSGDFYWHTNRNGKVFIAVCDCTGHGVPGAFVSMIGASLLKDVIIEKGIEEPGEILSALSRGVKDIFTQEGQLEAQDGMDMSLCVFEKNNADIAFQRMKFAGANNSLLLVRKESEIIEIKADRTPIGGNTEVDFEFETREINLSKGDSVYMYTDGYIDQFGGPKSKKFMKKNFKDLLTQIHQQPMEDQLVEIKEKMKNWIGEGEQVDDILVIGIGV